MGKKRKKARPVQLKKRKDGPMIIHISTAELVRKTRGGSVRPVEWHGNRARDVAKGRSRKQKHKGRRDD